MEKESNNRFEKIEKLLIFFAYEIKRNTRHFFFFFFLHVTESSYPGIWYIKNIILFRPFLKVPFSRERCKRKWKISIGGGRDLRVIRATQELWRATYWSEQRRECHILEYRKSSARAQSSVRFDSPSPSILSFHSFIRDNHNKYKTSVSSVGRSRTRMMCLSVLSDSKRAYKITWNLQFFSPPLYCMEWHNEKRQKRWKENNSWL